ncbi:MAG: hypothetical protein KKG99_10905 [Bacteroidetes bacterium]|nr:hypothetical protein [Bacteroidota bacterium]
MVKFNNDHWKASLYGEAFLFLPIQFPIFNNEAPHRRAAGYQLGWYLIYSPQARLRPAGGGVLVSFIPIRFAIGIRSA